MAVQPSTPAIDTTQSSQILHASRGAPQKRAVVVVHVVGCSGDLANCVNGIRNTGRTSQSAEVLKVSAPPPDKCVAAAGGDLRCADDLGGIVDAERACQLASELGNPENSVVLRGRQGRPQQNCADPKSGTAAAEEELTCRDRERRFEVCEDVKRRVAGHKTSRKNK